MSRLMEGLPFFPSVASTSQGGRDSNSAYDSFTKLRVTLLSSEWRSTKGGLSTINRELAIQLAKHPSVEVSVYLPQCSEDDKRVAKDHSVSLIEAEEMLGLEPDLWLSCLPEDHAVDFVIGHGAVFGRQVQIIKRHHHCKWIQVVHTAPEELGMYKEYEERVSKGEKKHQVEVELCKLADQVVSVGPKLAEAFSGYLRPCGKDQDVLNLTPGIFSEFVDVKQATEERNSFNVLVFGRGDNEDFQLKGYDIAAKAIAELKDMTYKLVFVGATRGEEENVAKKLVEQGIDPCQLRVRCFNESREKLADLFCEVDLAIMPSRTEGFGLAALEALSAGLPVLVSGNSGFGEALKKVPFASSCVVESDDPKEWASAIKVVRHKDREMRLGESKVVRGAYGEKYSWKEQCDKLVERMRNILEGSTERRPLSLSGILPPSQPYQLRDASNYGESLDLRFDCNVPEQVDASLPLNVNREQNALDRRIPSSQEVLNLIATKYFETINPSNQEELNGFLQYMEKVRKLILVDVKTGSLIITVRCSSLRILDELWEDYCTGHLNKVAQRYLVTEDFLKELGLDSVQLTLNINEEEYKAYRKHLLKSEVSSFNLEENQTRWVVIGICLNRLLLPVLRDFVGKEMHKHYASLKSAHRIDTQVYGRHKTHDEPSQLNYGSINNNWGNFKKNVRSYDYKVGTAEDLAKLYLEPHIAKFTGFDNTCDLNAVLGILERASVFHTRIQTSAKDVRFKVRYEWGHCNFDHWTDVEFQNSFQLMETMVRSLGLAKADEDKQLDELHHWESKGLQLSTGYSVDYDLMKRVSVELNNVEKEVDNIRQSNTDEANKVSMAGPASGCTSPFLMPPPGKSAAPMVITGTSTSTGPVSSFDLEENQKRWVVIGICLNRLLLPVLRDFVGQEIPKHYASLKSAHGIDTQVYGSHLPQDGASQLNYGSIHNNWGNFKKNVRSYNYKVGTAEDLAKLYLEPHMAKFTGFDNTCDLSAVLGILERASTFSAYIQISAKDMRSNVRNDWGHCNFDHWTDLEFLHCFQVMETMVRSLGLPKADEQKTLDEIRDWEKKGLNLCMGCPVDNDLMKFISVEVTNLEKEVANIKQYSSDEASKITAALQTTRDEVDKVHERITDIEKQMDTDRKERLEKQEALSSDIEDISNTLAKLDKSVDVNKGDISQLKEKQSDFNTTVSTITDDQARLTEDIGALKMEHSQLDARVKALESGSFKITNAKIFQVPSRNRCFCGRDRELEAIAAQLKYSQTGCIHSAICGLGGVGKTSLAVEFLWQQKGEYPGGIFWISGENNDLFQRSVCEMARQIGTFENDFNNSLSSTLEWLGKREELWCLVIDNLDELEMSKEMRKLLSGHWKHVARGHIIITTRREVSEVGEETGIDEQCCINLKCLTEEEGIYFLRKRTGKDEGDENDLRELVRELGGLPLALDQAGAYIRWVKQSVKEYVKKYRKQKLLLLKKKKAQLFVENTSPERLAVHTTWTLNFHHISHISKEMGLGEFPIRFMQVCAFYGPDDIPYELVNEGLKEDCSSAEESGLWDQAEIVSLLTNFSLFQRFESESFSVHRLVQEVIRSQMEKEQTELALSRAVCVLHHALKNTRSPAEVCERFVEDAVFSVDNPPSLHLWGKLALHSTYLQEHLRNYSSKHKESVHTLLYTEETVRVFNEASIFFSVSQEKVKAQELQKLKLDFLVNITKATTEDGTKRFKYFLDIPLKDKEYKLISHCMRQPSPEDNSPDVAETSRIEMEDKANQIREQGNLAVKRSEFEEASELYSTAIKLKVDDWRLFANRALCYLKLGRPQQALEDCEKCLSLDRNNSKALQRKIWALHNLVNEGATHLNGQKRATMAVAVYFHPNLRTKVKFCKMFPEVRALSPIEITNETQLALALMMRKGNETFLLREGKYNLKNFTVLTNLQMVGLEQQVVLNCIESCGILHQSKCYFENIVFPKGSSGIICQGKDAAIHMNKCESSGGFVSCEDTPECNGGPGCIAASLGKPVCDRTDKFGDQRSESGVAGSPGIQISNGSFALIENCVIQNCGGGGALVACEGSYLEVRKCEIHRNHQAGLEARAGGQLFAFKNRVFNNGYHGILIGPNAGECDVNENKVFENAKEGIFVGRTEHKIVLRNNDVHHNRLFGISLLEDPLLLVSNNRIFENGFWGIHAQLRTSAKITENVISGNKCGGIFINVNYSGRVYLDSNIVRDHSGPWLFGEHEKNSEFPLETSLLSNIPGITPPPPGEKNVYSNPPILFGNKEFNNKEGIYHPTKVVERLHNVCTFCRESRHEGKRFIKCSTCQIASYCSKECQSRHLHAHEALCKALKSRYSITFDETSLRNRYALRYAIHVKGSGTGPELKLNSREKFIIKIQTQTQNGHPKQLLHVYDQSRTLECDIQSPEIFNIIMECGVLGSLNKHTSKKVFFLASFDEGGKKLTIYLDQLAPYQQW